MPADVIVACRCHRCSLFIALDYCALIAVVIAAGVLLDNRCYLSGLPLLLDYLRFILPYISRPTHCVCRDRYTGWPKNGAVFLVRLNFIKILILTDFQNYFTVRIRRKCVIILSLKIPPHLKCVATLPCEMSSVFTILGPQYKNKSKN